MEYGLQISNIIHTHCFKLCIVSTSIITNTTNLWHYTWQA